MAGKRIVAIDDSPMILRAVRLALEKSGFEVITLESPSGFESVRSQQPDLILLDINMPELYGDDAVEFFRQEWKVLTPIYLCSDIPEEELRQRAASSGANGYICKGWGLDVLVKCVREALNLPPP